MGTDVSVQGNITSLSRRVFTDGAAGVEMTQQGAILTASYLPNMSELTRMGDSWQVANSAGQAALTALPTTVAGLSLWNGEVATGKQYAIDSFGVWEAVVDATQADNTALFVCNNLVPVATPTNAALSIRSLGGRAYGGKARTMAGGTITNEGWFPHQGLVPNAAAAGGTTWKVTEVRGLEIQGLYFVQPGGMFNIQAVKVAAAAAQCFFFIRWHEVLFKVNP